MTTTEVFSKLRDAARMLNRSLAIIDRVEKSLSGKFELNECQFEVIQSRFLSVMKGGESNEVIRDHSSAIMDICNFIALNGRRITG